MVKSHLTLAVKEEIVTLKNQIKQLNEVCTRLEHENQILKQNATSETLLLLESRGNMNITNSISNSNNNNSNSINGNQSNGDSAIVNSNNNNNINAPIAGTIQLVNSADARNILPVNQESMISSFTEHDLTNNGDTLTNVSNNNNNNININKNLGTQIAPNSNELNTS